jgi:hypothetical protein
MLFDSALLFFHAGSGTTLVFNFTAGEFVNVAGSGTASACASTVINLGNARDLGIGNGPDTPMVSLTVGTAFTSSCASTLINAQFQGSTNSTLWTTYAESGAASTASWAVGAQILPINVPRRPTGAGLPLYYRVNLAFTGANAGETLSTGTIIGGIVLARADSADTLGMYPAGFSVS